MYKILSKSKSEKDFEKLLGFLLSSIEEKVKKYFKDPSYNNLMLIQNFITFFMVLILNLKDNKSFVKIVFNGESQFFSKLCNIFFSLEESEKEKLSGILNLLNNIFFEEYKQLFFSEKGDEELSNLYIKENTEFSSKWINNSEKFDNKTYKTIFDKLKDFDISYTNFFQNEDSIDDDDKPSYKLCIAQSIIRAAFSKEKKKYCSDERFFEYNLLKKIVDKDMKETVEKYGDEYKTLFRKEDLCDDIIKYMFFIFGNSMLIDSFVKPLKMMLKDIGITDEMIEKKDQIAMTRDIKKDEFNKLVGTIIDTLSAKIPVPLKILLKILYESVGDHFTIEKDNYGPLYTSLIFNFLISPRIQMLYSINPLNCVFVRSLNRLLRNTCFNFKFAEGDPLCVFNDSIEKNNIKLKKLIKDQIISITITDKEKDSLSDLFTEKYLIYPKFLFYWDSKLLGNTISGGVYKMIDFVSIDTKKKEANV